MKKIITLILIFTTFLLSQASAYASPAIQNTTVNLLRMLHQVEDNHFYEELTEMDGIYTYFLNNGEQVVVITYSEEGGIQIRKNKEGMLSGIDMSSKDSDKFIKNNNKHKVKDYQKISRDVIKGKIKLNDLDISKIVEVSIQEEEDTTINFTTTSLGPLDHARIELEKHRGSEYRDRLINSATIEGYRVQVWEDKVLHVSERTRHRVASMAVVTTVLALLEMPNGWCIH